MTDFLLQTSEEIGMAKKRLKRNETQRRDFRYKVRNGKKYDDDVQMEEIPFLPPPLGEIFTGNEYRKVLWLAEHSGEFGKYVTETTDQMINEVQQIEQHYAELMASGKKTEAQIDALIKNQLRDMSKVYKQTGDEVSNKLGQYDVKQHKFEMYMEHFGFEMNESSMATILQSEIFAVGNEIERAVVAWCVHNRMRRNGISLVDLLFDKGIPFNRSQRATRECKDWIWYEFYSGMTPDLTNGATHYYSPQKMPKPGDEKKKGFKGKDTRGGIVETPSVGEHYSPEWTKTKAFSEIKIEGVRPALLRVYKKRGSGEVR